jgi:ribosome biogenesis GTPase / thiamine phosphate phosphatase
MEPVVERSSLDSWGYPPFSAAFSALARPDLSPARVVSDLGARLDVVDAHGVRPAQLSGRLRHALRAHELPTVGDWVAIAHPGDLAEPAAIIHHVLPRRTRLVRRAAGRRDDEQVVAANVDTVFVVTSANRDASARRIERYLTAIWDSGAAPVIVVSKIDLCGARELGRELAELAAAAPGVPIVAVSAHTGAGLPELAAHLGPRHTVALVGTSGVGKSSLVNSWLGRDQQAILPIDANDRGRHATTRRELFALPSGALVIDTPGMRSFGLLDAGSGLDETFADIAELATACRFRDCHHDGEPGCAVAAAIDAGELDPSRIGGLHKLERELAAAERRRDPALAREERARWKAIHKSLRARGKVDPKLRR